MSFRTVLVVEDDPGIREVLKDVLELDGYTVLTAENGLDALRVLESAVPPCLILLDLMMPVMNGWEFLESVYERGDTMVVGRVAVVTAVADLAGLERFGCRVIRKPPDIDQVLAVAREHCDCP